MKLIVTAVLAGVLGAHGAIASQRSDSTASTRPHEHERSDPWRGLFVVKPLPSPEGQSVTVLPLPSQAAALPQRHQPQRGPCNMPIVPANPDVDRRMIVPIPANGAHATIRVVEPTICGHTNLWDTTLIQAVPARNRIGSQTVTIDRKR
jgi:hypothetical protein